MGAHTNVTQPNEKKKRKRGWSTYQDAHHIQPASRVDTRIYHRVLKLYPRSRGAVAASNVTGRLGWKLILVAYSVSIGLSLILAPNLEARRWILHREHDLPMDSAAAAFLKTLTEPFWRPLHITWL